MKDTMLQAAREILIVELTDEQVIRCFQAAAADADHWAAEADADELPNYGAMEPDWWVDRDLRDAGVDDYRMQSLSFMIARARATAKAIEALAAL